MPDIAVSPPSRAATPRLPDRGHRPGAASRNGIRRVTGHRSFGLVIAIAVLLTFLAFTTSHYFVSSNLKVLALQVTVTGIPALGMTMLMIGGYVDLSIGSVFSLDAVWGVQLASAHGFWFALIIILLLSALIGLINGYLVYRLSISPLIVTLAALTFYQGVINLATSGEGASDLSKSFTGIGQGSAIFGIPNIVIIMVVLAILVAAFMSKTSGGLSIYGVGGSTRASKLAGIKVRRVVLGLFVVNMMIVGVAALLNASQFGGAQTSQGVNLELNVITAVVLGGVSFTGGEGGILGPILAAILLVVVSSGIVALNINPYWSDIVSGLLLAGAVATNQLTEEQRERYRRLLAMRSVIEPDGDRNHVPGDGATASAVALSELEKEEE